MKNYINHCLLLCLFSFLLGGNLHAQTDSVSAAYADSIIVEPRAWLIEKAYAQEYSWRNTGAISTISGEELERMTSGSLLANLAGRIPGLTVMTGSGEPGYDDPSLVIRGQSSWQRNTNNMLFYMDGFEVDKGALSSISAEEIETITILKDASALAMYGLRGANGAILLKSKKGILSKPIVTLNARYGMQRAVQLPSSLNAYDYTRLYNQARENDGLPIKYADPELYKATNDPFHPNVNWYKEVLKTSSPIQNYNLSFRGGDRTAKYYVLLDHYNTQGLYKNADIIDKDYGTNQEYKKYNIRGNLHLQLTKSFSLQTEISGRIEDRNTPAGFGAQGLFDGLLNTPAAAFPVKNPDGSWGTNSTYNFNPVAQLQQAGIYNAHNRNLQTNFSFTLKLDQILEGLSLTGGASLSSQYIGTYWKYFGVPTYEISKDANDNPLLDAEGNPIYIVHGESNQIINDDLRDHWNTTTVQVGLNYIRTFKAHTFTSRLLAVRNQFTATNLTYAYKYQGITGNVTYDYNKKYILDFSFGMNGSGDYAKGHQYGFFPAVGAGWILSNEEFVKSVSWINFLKIKGSYGLTGNSNVEARYLFEHWGVNNVPGYIVGDNNSNQGGWKEGQLGNANATWEEKKTLNVGFEATVFKNITIGLDVFKETRSGIIQTPAAEVPAYTGFILPYVNSGVVKNRGFETSVSYVSNVAKDFSFNIAAHSSFARNEISEISETVQLYSYLYAKGHQLGQFRGLQHEGFYQEADFDADGVLNEGVVKSSFANVKPGDLKYIDQNGDGIISTYDMKPMKYSNVPEWMLGLNLGIKFKGFDFNTFFQGVANRTVYMPFTYSFPFVNTNNITPFSANSWTPETAGIATSPRLSTQLNINNYISSDFYMRDGNFIKLKNIELGYTIPKKSIFKRFDGVRIYVNGTNLFIWDKIDRLEAENLSMGYPLMKSISIGMKAQL